MAREERRHSQGFVVLASCHGPACADCGVVCARACVQYIGDTVDKNEKWSTEVYDAFVAAGVVGSTTRDRAVFYLYNVIRKPQLRLPKIVDKFFENAERTIGVGVAVAVSLIYIFSCA